MKLKTALHKSLPSFGLVHALPKYLALLALCGCTLAPLQAFAQQSRIAWLTNERIFNESRLAKQASEKLAAEFKSREQAVADYVWGEASDMFTGLTPLELLQLVGDPAVLSAGQAA